MKYILPLIIAIYVGGCASPQTVQHERKSNLHPDHNKHMAVYNNLDKEFDKDKLYNAMSYFQHHNGWDDPPGSYKIPIKIGLRIIEIDKTDIYAYESTAILMFSQWADWKRGKLEIGEGAWQDGINILYELSSDNNRSISAQYIAADTMLPYLTKHPDLGEYWDVWEKYMFKSWAIAEANRDKENMAFIAYRLAHVKYKHLGDYYQADHWYKTTLDHADKESSIYQVSFKRLMEIDEIRSRR